MLQREFCSVCSENMRRYSCAFLSVDAEDIHISARSFSRYTIKKDIHKEREMHEGPVDLRENPQSNSSAGSIILALYNKKGHLYDVLFIV